MHALLLAFTLAAPVPKEVKNAPAIVAGLHFYDPATVYGDGLVVVERYAGQWHYDPEPRGTWYVVVPKKYPEIETMLYSEDHIRELISDRGK